MNSNFLRLKPSLQTLFNFSNKKENAIANFVLPKKLPHTRNSLQQKIFLELMLELLTLN